MASRHSTSQPAPASRSRGSVAVFSALLPFYASPCSAASRWWRIALAPGFVGMLCCIASIQPAHSHATRGYPSLSLFLSNTVAGLHGRACKALCATECRRVRRPVPASVGGSALSIRKTCCGHQAPPLQWVGAPGAWRSFALAPPAFPRSPDSVAVTGEQRPQALRLARACGPDSGLPRRMAAWRPAPLSRAAAPRWPGGTVD